MDVPEDQPLTRWLGEFALATRRLTVASFSRANTCVASSRLGQAVLERFGIVGRPQSVTVGAFNAEAWKLASAGAPIERWPASAHSVGVAGTGVTTRVSGDLRWDGHLVLIVRRPGRTRLLIDLTGDQLGRPERGIVVPGPVLLGLPQLWTPKDPGLAQLDEGTVVAYRPSPRNVSWRRAPDWTRPEGVLEEAVEDLVEQLTTPVMRPTEPPLISRVQGYSSERSGRPQRARLPLQPTLNSQQGHAAPRLARRLSPERLNLLPYVSPVR